MVAVLLLLFIAQAPAAPVAPSEEGLAAEVRAVDSEYFRLLWQDCEAPEKLAALISPDQEFYHDRHGLSNGIDGDLRFLRRRCENLKKTGATTRREIVPGTFRVDLVPGFGAVASGDHRFYRTDPGKPERLLGSARFTIVWKKKAEGGWQAHRVLSLDHQDAPK